MAMPRTGSLSGVLVLLRRFRPHGLALALYGVLALIALDDLVIHFGTAIPGGVSNDYSVFYWNLWWVKYALFNLHRDPLLSNYVLYPSTVNLSLHTLGLTLGLLTAPLQLFLNLKLIYNGLLVASFLASGYCTFLFLRRHVQNDSLAIMGGALFAFTPATIDHASYGHLHLMQTWWMPVTLLAWDDIIARRTASKRILAAAGFGLALYLAWNTGIEILMWSGMLLAPYALYTWLTRCQGWERVRVIGLALVAGLFFLGPALIEPLPATLQARNATFSRAGLDTAQFYSYRLEWLFTRDPDRLGDSVGQLFPLLTLVCLFGRKRSGERWLWFALGLGAFVLSLGPVLNGTNIPLPYLALHNLFDG